VKLIFKLINAVLSTLLAKDDVVRRQLKAITDTARKRLLLNNPHLYEHVIRQNPAASLAISSLSQY